MVIFLFYKRNKKDSLVVFLFGLYMSYYVFKRVIWLYFVLLMDLKRKGSYWVIIYIYKLINCGL